MSVYYAHPVSAYDTAQEASDVAVIESTIGTVVNPNSTHHNERYQQAGMPYFFDEVLPACQSCVVRAFDDGKIGAGVYAEAEWFIARGLPVREITDHGIGFFCLEDSRRLTVDETKTRVRKRRVIAKFSGGVTSAWVAGWALRNFPPNEVDLLFHDTKDEDEDTYRFLREMAAALGKEIVERSDGRSVDEVFEDEGILGNNQQSPCSRILKQEPGDAYIKELQAQGFEVVVLLGFSADEPRRVNGAVGRAANGHRTLKPYTVRFPIIEDGVTKQQCADWCQCEMGVRPSRQYEWFDHANCKGCVKGGLAYWLKTAEVYPDVFERRAQQEEAFGHTIIRGGDREHPTLRELLTRRLKRKVNQRERIEIGACGCGD